MNLAHHPGAVHESSLRTALAARIAGIGLIGPGFADWPGACEVLAGRAAWQAAKTVLAAPALLPPAERRRTGASIKVALAIGLEAIRTAGWEARELATVFTSSSGDGDNCHAICEALAGADRQISPTRFHNTVHNAPAGDWGIATGAMAASTSLCAYDASFAAGLLEALTQVAVLRRRVVLIAFDTPYPEPLRAKRPIPDGFGVALALAPDERPTAWPRLSARLTGEPADALQDAALEALRLSIPAARALPLLQAIAGARSGRTVLEYLAPRQLAVSLDFPE